MKFFIVFACALAAVSAGHVHPVVYGAQHLPVIGANGVPVDTADVQIARAAHAVHKVDALARNGDLYHGVIAHAAPVLSTYAAHGAPLVSTYAAHATPLVAAHGVHHATSLVAAHGVAAHGVAAYPTTAVLPTNINGTPLETPEVVAAKLNHFAAHADAAVRNVHGLHYRKRRGILAASPLTYAAPWAYAAQHLPIIGANGVPVDTAEVQHARAAHLAHKVEAHVRNGDYAVAAPLAYHHSPIVASTYAHSPLVASTYAHSPLVASSYAHSPLVASTYAAHSLAYNHLY